MKRIGYYFLAVRDLTIGVRRAEVLFRENVTTVFCAPKQLTGNAVMAAMF
ncbi:MAG: hypothetical protein ACREX3_13650 [Gammaproteobacteria bacterium]